MPDMICSLIHLPASREIFTALRDQGVHIRRVNPWEKSKLCDFIRTHFSQGWIDETDVALSRQPVTCYVAVHNGQIIGFANYECSRRSYFGPTGVDPAWRGKGIGKALLFAALRGLRELGYTYAIIGDAGPVDFYRATVGAMPLTFGDGRGVYSMQDDPAFLD